MANKEALDEYLKSVSALRKQCKDAGMTEDEFKKLYYESLQEVETENSGNVTIKHNRKPILTKYRIVLLTVLIFTMIYNFKIMYSHMQEFIYPSLKVIRKLSIPFISLFPSLTEMYHETCLVQNPFFTVVDMECWPCNTVHSIQILDEPVKSTQHHTPPFIYKTNQKVVTIQDLQVIYSKNKELFDAETPRVLRNNKYYIEPEEMFKLQEDGHENNQFIWKLITMNAARMLRQLIPRPHVVPKYGQSTERFIIIDNSKVPLKIPDTECSFSFVQALSGSRVIDLKPAEECKHHCRSIKVELKESHLLWYNWWYWKPEVLPSSGNETLIAHVGSYC